jgi:uncharacterized phage infection (PIP) family protein YhgE
MKYAATFALLAVFGMVPGFSQTSQGQEGSETLKEILTEIRGIHNDVRLSETTQILLTELEVQQTAVGKAMQKRDDLKNLVSQLQAQQKNIATQLARFQDNADATIDPVQKKQIEQAKDNFTAQLASMKSQEQDTTNDLAQADGALRKEQDTLQGIQDRLDDVVKKLQPVSSQ